MLRDAEKRSEKSPATFSEGQSDVQRRAERRSETLSQRRPEKRSKALKEMQRGPDTLGEVARDAQRRRIQ